LVYHVFHWGVEVILSKYRTVAKILSDVKIRWFYLFNEADHSTKEEVLHFMAAALSLVALLANPLLRSAIYIEKLNVEWSFCPRRHTWKGLTMHWRSE